MSAVLAPSIIHAPQSIDAALSLLSHEQPYSKWRHGEIWKRVDQRTDYAISSEGLVFSIRRNRILAPSVTSRGYAQIKLGKDHRQSVHRLVALAFVPNPDGKKQVNHIDGVKLNNCADNLEWVSQSENMRHAYALGLQRPTVWSDANKKKLSELNMGRPPCSEETRRRMSAAATGKRRAPRTEEHKRNISEALRRKRSQPTGAR